MNKDIEKVNLEFRNIGIFISDIYEIVNSSVPYPNAIPLLIRLLEEGINDCRVKEGIIRALAVKEAKGIGGKILIEEFNKLPVDNILLRWSIGNTMDVVISEKDINDVINIVNNKENGISRQMFVLSLGNIKTVESEICLISLLNDDEVTSHAIKALVKMKSTKAKNQITNLLNHRNKLIQKEAKKALKKIE